MAGPVLVTGGAGYIGSHTVKALRRSGRRVVIFDNLSAGHRAATLGTDLIVGDVRDQSGVRDAIRTSGASAVVHFAALLNVADSVTDPAGYYSQNVAGALSVLGAMAAESVRAFVFSSSCATYGEPVETPMSEEHSQRPINAYGETKLAVERALPHFERAYGLRYAALRYLNAAGADPDGELGEDHDPEIHLIPLAIRAATGGTPLRVFGDDYPTPDGTCLRDYIHVADLADAHVRALEAIERGACSNAFNVGTGQPTSVRQVIDAVSRVVGRPVPHAVAPRRPGDPAALFAAAGRIRGALGWSPRFTAIDDIVRTAWAWHAAHPRGFAS